MEKYRELEVLICYQSITTLNTEGHYKKLSKF